MPDTAATDKMMETVRKSFLRMFRMAEMEKAQFLQELSSSFLAAKKATIDKNTIVIPHRFQTGRSP